MTGEELIGNNRATPHLARNILGTTSGKTCGNKFDNISGNLFGNKVGNISGDMFDLRLIVDAEFKGQSIDSSGFCLQKMQFRRMGLPASQRLS